jgi:hypothetical protein
MRSLRLKHSLLRPNLDYIRDLQHAEWGSTVNLHCKIFQPRLSHRFNFCRAISRNARPLYPTKLPRRPFAIEAVRGQERPPAPQKNSEAFRRRTGLKPVTDLPIGA